MSPLVERSRMAAPQRVGTPRAGAASTDQHWSMLAFQSLSAGTMALFVGFVLVIVVVGLYVLIVWPLTFWDLADSGLEKYSGMAKLVLWSVFGGGSLAGYWCFSGRAFKPKAKKLVDRNGRVVRR